MLFLIVGGICWYKHKRPAKKQHSNATIEPFYIHQDSTEAQNLRSEILPTGLRKYLQIYGRRADLMSTPNPPEASPGFGGVGAAILPGAEVDSTFRVVMAELRREVEEIRQNQVSVDLGAPPLYSDPGRQ